MKKHSNLSFFVPHLGCPHACVFCNQRNISGESCPVTPERVREDCERYLPADGRDTEIAFFGGSFTAIDPKLMEDLLKAAYPFVEAGRASGIRCSTRPDAIDERILETLKKYGVTAVELGAQSMLDSVLQANKRGHSSEQVRTASELIKKSGISLGLQMMEGMYGDTDPENGALYTAEQLIALRPDTVRIYPTIVVANTELEKLCRSGEYHPLTVDMAVEITAKLLMRFREEGIKVIRVGLHYEESLEKTAVAGPFHPAFGELCESRIYRDKLEKLTEDRNECSIICPSRLLSQVAGQKKSNLKYLEELGKRVNLIQDPDAEDLAIK